jgi:hypothetical protein
LLALGVNDREVATDFWQEKALTLLGESDVVRFAKTTL